MANLKWREPVGRTGGVLWSDRAEALKNPGATVRTWNGSVRVNALSKRPGNDLGCVFVDFLVEVDGALVDLVDAQLEPAQARALAANLRKAARAAERTFKGVK